MISILNLTFTVSYDNGKLGETGDPYNLGPTLEPITICEMYYSDSIISVYFYSTRGITTTLGLPEHPWEFTKNPGLVFRHLSHKLITPSPSESPYS